MASRGRRRKKKRRHPLQLALTRLWVSLAVAGTLGAAGRALEAPGAHEPEPGPSRGCVVFVFADGPSGAYDYAYPLLASHSWAGVALVNPTTIGRRAKLSEAECAELDRSGWDIASHGYRHENPTALSPLELDEDLRLARDWLLARGFARGARHYAPPLQASTAVRDAGLRYFRTVLPADAASPFAALPAGWIYASHTASEGQPWASLEAEMSRALEPGHVVFLNFHQVVGRDPRGLEASVAQLERVADYVAKAGLHVVTLSDLLDGRMPPK